MAALTDGSSPKVGKWQFVWCVGRANHSTVLTNPHGPGGRLVWVGKLKTTPGEAEDDEED